jgi:outer membrane protein TolC
LWFVVPIQLQLQLELDINGGRWSSKDAAKETRKRAEVTRRSLFILRYRRVVLVYAFDAL